MPCALSDRIRALASRGVRLVHPETVWIGEDVHPDRIGAGAVIHPGCRLSGGATSVGPGCELGAEAPVTLRDCQLGRGVRLQGGFFQESTFLDGASMGSGAQVRGGTLLEEEACGAHAVGLKQTILMPCVVLGSLINFCDCLMAGGTSRSHHSEVGSGYIHFNYTPHQDKATASLIGDVARGVRLDQPPIFLGGQGGLVGPARIEFGAVIPAGVIVRGDVLRPGLWRPPAPRPGAAAPVDWQPGAWRDVRRLVRNNLAYLGNLLALRAWYRHVRALRMGGDPAEAACLAGARERLETCWRERLKRLEDVAARMPRSLELARAAGRPAEDPLCRSQALLRDRWPRIREALEAADRLPGAERDRDRLLAALDRQPPGTRYLEAVRALDPAARAAGTAWLQSLAEAASGLWPDPAPER